MSDYEPSSSQSLSCTRSMISINSDDEYNYSDLEEEEEEDQTTEEEEVIVLEERETSSATHEETKGSSKKRTNSGLASTTKVLQDYRVIEEEELLKEQQSLIQEIAQVLEIKESIAALLLRSFGWNKEKLYEGYYLDPLKAREEAGLQYADVASPVFSLEEKKVCDICCDEYPSNQVFAMGCLHVFCVHCWSTYLSTKVKDGQSCITTSCPAHGCKAAVSDVVFKQFLSSEEYKKYIRYRLRSYVDINKCVKWCPSPGCTKAISSAGGLLSVQCSCSCVFCLRCGEEAHAPVSCEQLMAWQEKCRNESETANWMLANTKKCPKCEVRIEKNQGCNHMTCRKCSYEFCWMCMQGWDKHGSGTGGYYKCNRYEVEKEQNTDAARAKAELERYLHYYQRYANHSEAGKFAQRMREGTEARMMEVQTRESSSSSSSWIDVQFLNAATELLMECRRVLKYTYAFGYYLPHGKEKNLFEYLQENLEKNCEQLTHLSEMPLEQMDRAEIVNYTRVTETFLRNLIVGVEDGLTSNELS